MYFSSSFLPQNASKTNQCERALKVITYLLDSVHRNKMKMSLQTKLYHLFIFTEQANYICFICFMSFQSGILYILFVLDIFILQHLIKAFSLCVEAAIFISTCV